MIYHIKNPFGISKYVVPFGTPVTDAASEHVLFGGEELAAQKLAEMRQSVLAQESYRFVASKVTVAGNDTTWSSADFDSDLEIGDYRVFNQATGKYEEFTSLTEAKQRFEELKADFLESLGLDAFNVVDSLPAAFAEPTVIGAQTL